jgi:hypothetical protein
MSRLRFTDGTEVETAGQYRVMMMVDGFYVVGCGHMIPVRDCEEAYQTIAELKELEKPKVDCCRRYAMGLPLCDDCPAAADR